MGRIRSIKPEFPQSETVGRLSRDARLLFIQLWTIVDDSGKSRAASRMLASLLYPYDDDAAGLMDGWLGKLEAEHCIARYEVDGSRYLQITKWLEHQKIDKPSKSRFPQFDEASRIFAKPREPSTTDLGPRTLDLGPSTKDLKVYGAVADATRPARNEAFEEFWKAYPKRLGANPKAPALKVFQGHIKAKADPQAIIGGARRCALAPGTKVGTEFVPRAVTWLRERRWEDYPEGATPTGEAVVPRHGDELADGQVYLRADTHEYDAWADYYRKAGQKHPPRYFHGGWKFPSRWPPGAIRSAVCDEAAE